MHTYETVIIFNSKSKTLKDSITLLSDVCQTLTGSKYKIKVEDIGEKTLAYEIKSHKSGYYVLLTWKGTPDNVSELERNLRINDDVLKFITVIKEDEELEEFQEEAESEQATDTEMNNSNAQIDALDVMLGFADYIKK